MPASSALRMASRISGVETMSIVRTGTSMLFSKLGPRLQSEPISARIRTPLRQYMDFSIAVILSSTACGRTSSGMSTASTLTSVVPNRRCATSTIEVAVLWPCVATTMTTRSSRSSSCDDSSNRAMYSISTRGTSMW